MFLSFPVIVTARLWHGAASALGATLASSPQPGPLAMRYRALVHPERRFSTRVQDVWLTEQPKLPCPAPVSSYLQAIGKRASQNSQAARQQVQAKEILRVFVGYRGQICLVLGLGSSGTPDEPKILMGLIQTGVRSVKPEVR